MTYTPQYLSNLVPPIATTTGAAWQRARANHDQVWATYESPVAQWAGMPFFTTVTGADENLFRFRSRNGDDFATGAPLRGLQLRVEVFARRTNGAVLAGQISLKGGAATVTASISALTFTKVTLTATPATADEEWTVSALAAAGDIVEICALVAYWQPTSVPGAVLYPSGFRTAEASWDTTDRAISTELAARLLDGPVCIAKDRPACIFSHLWRANSDDSSFSKMPWLSQDLIVWGVSENAERVMCGRGRIPRADIRSRRYVVTYYLRSSVSATGSIAIGASSFAVGANAYGSFELELGPVDVDITASVDAVGVGEWAYFESVQVWRQAE
jgi:hypothetical protein